MKNILLSALIITTCLSCVSGLYKLDKKGRDLTEKSFDMKEFDIYVYNICEQFNEEANNNRFMDCPDKFFSLSTKDSIRKVEEVYILRHRKTDLALYFTTFSHKYIRQGKGFLNDQKYYKNRIILDQVEYVYIGEFNLKKGLIFFSNPKNPKDIILHFNINKFPNEIALQQANIATAENDYDTASPINLANVFRQDVIYSLSKDYKIDYYQNKSLESETPWRVSSLSIISVKSKLNVEFSFNEVKEKRYKLSSQRIKYHPNYYLIQD